MPRLLPLRAGLINPLCRSVVGGTFLRRVGELVSRKGPASMKGSRGEKPRWGGSERKRREPWRKREDSHCPFFGVCGTLCWAAGCWDASAGKGAVDGSSMPGNTALKESVEQPRSSGHFTVDRIMWLWFVGLLG